MVPGATVLYGTASASSANKIKLEGMAVSNEMIYAHVPLEALFPHHSRVMRLYDNAKKMIIVANATPVSNPADNKSARQSERGTYKGEGERTVVSLPPVERAPSNEIVEDESDDEP